MMVRARPAGIGMGNKETKGKKREMAQCLMPSTLVTAKHGEGLAWGQESYLPDLELELRPLEKWELAAPCK